MFWRADHSFWPSGLPAFDFSLKFEETILQVLPSSLFIVFAMVSLMHYFRHNARVRPGQLLWAKMV